MKRSITPIQYGMYVRRSSDSEDRQVQSLVRQKNDLLGVIKNGNLLVAHPPFEESQSAFKIGRPVFAELVQKTMAGEISGWICWHSNRLSRNPVDAGTVIHLMDLGYLKEIRTHSGVFTNNPSDKLLLAIEFGISKNDSEEKSAIIRSGIRRRRERGFPTGHPPVGFKLNSSISRTEKSAWVVDEKRLPKVRKVFRRFLEGRDSLTSITAFSKKIGLTTFGRRGAEGVNMGRSSIHRLLRNSIYAGMFNGLDDEVFPLEESLPRIVTEDEFERIGLILGDRKLGEVRRKRDYAFVGRIKCPFGESLAVDPKFHLVCDCRKKFSYLNKDRCPRCDTEISKMRHPRYRSYRYYFSRRSRRGVGRSIKAIEEKELRRLLRKHVEENIYLPTVLLDWSLKYLEELQDEALRNSKKEAQTRARLLRDIESKRRRLNDLRIEGTMPKAEYEERIQEFSQLEEEASPRNYAIPKDWKNEAKKIGCIAEDLSHLLEHGEEREINEALKNLGLSMVWDGSTLEFQHSRVLAQVIRYHRESSVKGRLESLRPLKIGPTEEEFSEAEEDLDLVRIRKSN